MLNVIDISSYQQTIDLDVVFDNNDLHGVIVKSTEGIGYTNPYCDKWVQWLIEHHKPWGFYHFLNGSDPAKEAQHFVKETQNYWGHGIPVADYEGRIVTEYGTYYLSKFLKECVSLTGIKPMVYCNLSTIQNDQHGFREIANDGYPLWLAQYASNRDAAIGQSVWQKGSYYPFPKITMHQYSDHGKLNGYTGYVDLDIFYGTAEDWAAIAGGVPEQPPEQDYLAQWIQYLEAEEAKIKSKLEELRRKQK